MPGYFLSFLILPVFVPVLSSLCSKSSLLVPSDLSGLVVVPGEVWEDKEKAHYVCPQHREVKDRPELSATCVGINRYPLMALSCIIFILVLRFIRTWEGPDWPECECVKATILDCSSASYSMTYPRGGNISATLSLNIPALLTANPVHWNLTVSLSIISKISSVSSTQAMVMLSSPSMLSIRSAGTRPVGGIVTVRLELGQGETVAAWKYPCVVNIKCDIPSTPITSVVGSIIISVVGLVFCLALLVCVKTCQWRAVRNDELRVRILSHNYYYQIIITVIYHYQIIITIKFVL